MMIIRQRCYVIMCYNGTGLYIVGFSHPAFLMELKCSQSWFIFELFLGATRFDRLMYRATFIVVSTNHFFFIDATMLAPGTSPGAAFFITSYISLKSKQMRIVYVICRFTQPDWTRYTNPQKMVIYTSCHFVQVSMLPIKQT